MAWGRDVREGGSEGARQAPRLSAWQNTLCEGFPPSKRGKTGKRRFGRTQEGMWGRVVSLSSLVTPVGQRRSRQPPRRLES